MLNLVQLYFFMLTCSVYNNIVGLIRKGYHGCKCCGTSLKARWSKHLGNLVYDCSRVFLLEDHAYKRVAFAFNGKPKRTQRIETMTLVDWIRAYDIEKEKEFLEMFDSNREPLFDDPMFLNTYDQKMPNWDENEIYIL